jgi:exonuclease SbcC
MRLHQLTITAIGPFPGTHAIDFSTLSAGGLFLLEGPTGAGKSTIIDAVVFALYGEPASLTSSRDRLTSRHSPPGTTPVVELVFETAAGVYRVRRSPEHLRPKQRGSGLTKEHAQVRLWRLADPSDGHGHPLSTRVGEADAELLRIIGLSREQFVQTVVLPQGEFATFLRATPEDRRVVLQRLFGTEIYQRMQDRLVDAARRARRDCETSRADACAAIHAFVRGATAGVAGGSADTTDPEPPPAVDLLADRLDQLTAMAVDPEETKVVRLASEVVEAFAQSAENQRAAEARAAQEEAGERRRADRTRSLAEMLTNHSRLLAEQAGLRSRDADVADVARRLEAARRATAVIPVLNATAAAVADVARTRTDLDRARGEVEANGDADLARLTSDLGEAIAEGQRGIGSLESVLEVERGLSAGRAALGAAREVLTEAVTRSEGVAAELVRRPERRARLESALAALRHRAAGAQAASVRLENAQRVLEAANEVAVLAEAEALATAAVARCAERAQEAVDHEAGLRRQRLADIAGELADGLHPGDACPVCGAHDHPSVARRSGDPVTVALIETAERLRAEAEAALSAARVAAGRSAAHLDAAREASLGHSPEAAAAEVRRLRAALDDSEAAAGGLAAAEHDVVEFDAETERMRTSREDLDLAVASARERIAAAERELAENEGRVARARGGHPSVAARAAALAARVAGAERLDAAAGAVATAEAREREQGVRLAAALAQAGFAEAAEAVAAARSEAEIRDLAEVVQAHHAATSRIEFALADPDLARLTGEERADVGAAEARLAEATAAHLTTARKAERARAALSSVRAAADALAEALERDTAASRAAEPVVRMAELAAAGDGNDRHHTLATFVLLRRFEDVVAAANVRLSAMSDGRYALARTDDREGGVAARKTGLGLVIEDLLVGDRRAARTLSGGETFYVSLCLALGLADVVRAEAGGIDLGTLFIDEGFGSLDPDTLDVVVRELGHLRSGGRVMGIVSHVAELKRRIAERIEVRRCPDGSSTLAVVA